jgi:hypothetical protein
MESAKTFFWYALNTSPPPRPPEIQCLPGCRLKKNSCISKIYASKDSTCMQDVCLKYTTRKQDMCLRLVGNNLPTYCHRPTGEFKGVSIKKTSTHQKIDPLTLYVHRFNFLPRYLIRILVTQYQFLQRPGFIFCPQNFGITTSFGCHAF